MKKTIKIIFTLSLLFNVILIGVVLGGFYKRHQHHKPPIELSENSQKILKENMRLNHAKMKKNFPKMKSDNNALKQVIVADDFDLKAYNQAIAKVLDHKNKFSRMRAESMGDVLSTLSKDERQKIAKRLVHSLAGGKNKGAHGKYARDKGKSKPSSDRPLGRQE